MINYTLKNYKNNYYEIIYFLLHDKHNVTEDAYFLYLTFFPLF